MARFLRAMVVLVLGVVAAAAPVTAASAAAERAGQVSTVLPFKCLDADNATPWQAGTKVQLWACVQPVPEAQYWWFYDLGGGYWQIRHTDRNGERTLCLDADTKTIEGNGTKVHLWPCAGGIGPGGNALNQVWYVYLAGGTWMLVNGVKRRCLDADRATANQNSTKVHLWDCAPGAPNQDWFTPVRS